MSDQSSEFQGQENQLFKNTESKLNQFLIPEDSNVAGK
jgi:hypothetical protein